MWAGQSVLVMLACSIQTNLSISECMRRSGCYRAVMLGLVLCQFWHWLEFFTALDAYLAKVFLAASCVFWVCLCADLDSRLHGVWTCLFGACFSLMAFAFYPFLRTTYDAAVWWLGFASLFASILSCLILFAHNSSALGFAEHVAFMAYNVTFIFYFHADG
jgi:hypothetical protein